MVAVLLGGVHGRGAGETEARNRVPLRVGAHPGAGSGGRDGRHEALDTGPCFGPFCVSFLISLVLAPQPVQIVRPFLVKTVLLDVFV